jgi:type VI secretion system VasD/TssJ family lipoprotein
MVYLMIRKSLLALSLVLIAVSSTACKGPMELAFSFTPNTDMNGGNALQVVVFQLSSNATFENTPVDSFWENDNAAIMSDLVSAKQKITLFPDNPQSLIIQPEKNAAYIGIAANYRSPDAQGWRVIYSVEELKGKAVELTAEENRFFARLR